jgi:hypothetical protein
LARRRIVPAEWHEPRPAGGAPRPPGASPAMGITRTSDCHCGRGTSDCLARAETQSPHGVGPHEQGTLRRCCCCGRRLGLPCATRRRWRRRRPSAPHRPGGGASARGSQVWRSLVLRQRLGGSQTMLAQQFVKGQAVNQQCATPTSGWCACTASARCGCLRSAPWVTGSAWWCATRGARGGDVITPRCGHRGAKQDDARGVVVLVVEVGTRVHCSLWKGRR